MVHGVARRSPAALALGAACALAPGQTFQAKGVNVRGWSTLHAAFSAERAAVLDKPAAVAAQTLLLLCLLVLLLIGLPFLSGFIAGRATVAAPRTRQTSEKSDDDNG